MTSDQDAPRDRWALRSLAVFIGVAGLLSACQDGETAPGAGQEGTSRADTAQSCASTVAATTDRVYFDYDSAELRPEARSGLDAVAANLLRQPQCRFVIEGHCDERGTREYNLALGEKRASVVMSYLAALGVDSARMETISYGKERPAVIGATEADWAKNRRAVMVFERGVE
jgi:peptidoglycan-associated lipoprotein